MHDWGIPFPGTPHDGGAIIWPRGNSGAAAQSLFPRNTLGLINPLNLPSQAHPRAGRAEADLRPSGT